MKKSLWLVCLSFSFIFCRGQDITRQDVDSMLKALNKSKGIERIDLLLNLAQFNIFKPGENQIDFDSATNYISEAKELCRSEKSLAGEGYALLTESYMVREKGKKEESKKMVEQAITILESGNNTSYLGQAYYNLASYFDYHDSLQFSKKKILVLQSIDAFQRAGDLKRKAMGLIGLGDLYSLESDDDSSIYVLKEAFAIYDSIKYQNMQGVCVLLGAEYRSQGDYPTALFYLLKALKTAQSVGDSSMQLCQIFNQLGIIYYYIDRFDMSIKYLNNAMDVAQKHKDEDAIFNISTTLCNSYNRFGQPEQALEALGAISKDYSTSDNIYKRHSFCVSYLRTFLALNQLGTAKKYLDITLELAEKKLVPDQQRNNVYRYVATYFFLKNEYSKTRLYLKKSFDAGTNISWEYGKIQNLQLLYMLDSAQGDMRSAFNHLILYKQKTDSVSSVRKITQFQAMNLEYEVETKEDSIKLKDKDLTLLKERNNSQLANLKRASLIKNVTIGGIILALIIIGLLYNRYRLKQRTNKKLELQKKEIAKQNFSLQHLVNEKEWLLKEIHHRVKNNLQIVMSLLNSQSAFIDNEPALTAIHDSQHRVHAMSLIHQKLYNTENLSSIDMSIYIRELATYLRDSFDIGQRIRFEFNIQPIEMDVSQAVPLGLILNEAITNSLKYAFPDNRNGVVSISLLKTKADQYLLNISDNGIGMPATIKKTGSLGMSLMKGLSEDIDGDFSIENDNGTTINISFIYEPGIKRSNLVSESFVSHN